MVEGCGLVGKSMLRAAAERGRHGGDRIGRLLTAEFLPGRKPAPNELPGGAPACLRSLSTEMTGGWRADLRQIAPQVDGALITKMPEKPGRKMSTSTRPRR